MSILALLGEDDGGPLVYVERAVIGDFTGLSPSAQFHRDLDRDRGSYTYERIGASCDGCPLAGLRGWPAVDPSQQGRLWDA